MAFGRRAFLSALVGLAACRGALAPKTARGVALWSWFDLPETEDTHGLSAIVWDERGRTAFAVQDKRPRIVAIAPDRELRTWQVGGHTEVDLAQRADLEALALLPTGFLVASEAGPYIHEVDRTGKVIRDIKVPASLRSARENRSLESLAVTADTRFVFTANEAATPADGALANGEHGTLVRIVRIDRLTGEVVERRYLTDHGFEDGDYGVADLAAISSTDVLVLERGWSKRLGNSARIYRTSLDASETAKQLVVDLALLDVKTFGLPVAREPQPSPLLDNFEGLAIGPRLPTGDASLLLVSDDNSRVSQVTRIVVLACPSFTGGTSRRP